MNDLDALSPAEREQRLKQSLVCPACGYAGDPNHGDGFRYLEDIACFRSVLGVGGGRLKIQGLYTSGEGYDEGLNPRLECRRTDPEFCGHEWPVPDEVLAVIEWV